MQKNKQNISKVQIKCKHCNNQNFIRQGFRKTLHRGKIQKYYCLVCKRNFTADFGFYRMRNNEHKITKAIDLYFSNLSSRKVRNHFQRHENTKASHITVLDWCRKYTLKVMKYANKLQPKLNGDFYADETEINCKGRKDNFWVCVDYNTRYIPATHYSLTTNINEAMTFLKKATAKKLPKYIQTDAAQFYPKAFKKLFYSNKIKGLRVQHRIQNYLRTGIHNYKIETVFMKVKDRVDDFRGLKATWSAPILLNGIILQHNFIEPHTTTAQIPSTTAGIQENTCVNKWLEIIKQSATI